MTREQYLEYEASLHRRYFEPFDRLLERKAEYYLKKTEEGKESRFLLEEIEVLERFREYVSILETITQRQLDEIYLLSLQIDHSAKAIKILNEIHVKTILELKTRLHPCHHQHSTK